MRRLKQWMGMITAGVLLVALALAWTRGAAQAQLTTSDIFLFDLRADLELLADSVNGGGARPNDWTGNIDVSSPTFTIDVWYDNELVANSVFDGANRPPGWIGASVAAPSVLARNVRHDLELSADRFFGLNQRPREWRGASPLLRCSRELQNTVALLNSAYGIRITTPESTLNYCAAVAVEIEDELASLTPATDPASGQPINLNDLLGSLRGDLERLADELYGLNNRPAGYIINRDPNTPSYLTDLIGSYELIADDRLGVGVRPVGYAAPSITADFANYLRLRENIERLTDELYAADRRPTGWQGAAFPLDRCGLITRGLALLAQQTYGFNPLALDVSDPAYCAQLGAAASTLVENPPPRDVVESVAEDRQQAESNYAFAYLDVAATQYMGIMPGGTRFRAVYRNFGQSNMMLVTSDQFALYVDWRFTTLPETRFRALPTLEGVRPITFCDASWCNGPGPTPTPTGGGPLINVLIGTTPVATPNPQQLQTTKQLVSWNFIRVTYVQDNLQARTAQVALEICDQPATQSANCEPVISAFDGNAGAPVPVITQLNGLNVYEFRYGYTQNVVIEGATRYSNDIWISDPTIR